MALSVKQNLASDTNRSLDIRPLFIACGLSSATLGFLVLVGWYTHTEPLIQLNPAFVPMQFNTAIGFLCCGFMILGYCRGMPRTVIVLAAIVLSIGSLTLIEYLLAVDLGIDQLLLEHYILVETSHPGRMAPNTALAFSFVAIAALMSRVVAPKLASPVCGIMSSLVFGLGISALLGYWLRLESAYGWGHLTQMAVHTALGFSVLGSGMIGIAWQSNRATGNNIPKWLPVPAALAIIIVTVSLWQALHQQNDPSNFQRPTDLILIFGLALAGALSLAMTKIISEIAGRQQLEHEIAERIEYEKRLQESQQRMQLVLQGAKLGTWDWNVRTGEVIFNERFARMVGYKLDELVPDVDTWKNMVHPDDWPGLQEVLEPHLAGRTDGYATEHRIQQKSGEWIWVLDTGTVIERDTDGKPVRMCGTHLDITKRKHAEEELLQYEHIVSSTTDMLALLDTNIIYLAANSAYLDVFGKSSEEVIGRSARELFGDDLFRNIIQPHAEACLAGEDVRYYDWFNFPDGGRKYMDISYSAYRGPDEEIRGFVVSGRDITAYKRLQEQLLQSQKMESVGQLAGGLAHDFNNMLGVIVGNAELAMESLDPAEPVHAELSEICKAARRSADLTQQLLAFARKQPIVPVVLKLNETVAKMLKMLHRLIGENIDLQWRPGKKIWPIKMDPSQIDQVMTNLCVNARDAIADVGKISIETENTHFDDAFCHDHPVFVAGDYVRLRVRDDGCGMQPQVIAKVFEPFFTTKSTGNGTGLGLAMVYGIVKQNGGFIDVASTAGHGSTFDIYLPREPDADTESPHEEMEATETVSDTTILVVDDEPAILRLTTTMLQRMGYTVLSASSPDAAIRLADEYDDEIHLLLTDVIMPMMNGRDLAERLLVFAPKLKQLFMSGFTADIISDKGALEKGVHFIQKPFSMKGLASKLQHVLLSTS